MYPRAKYFKGDIMTLKPSEQKDPVLAQLRSVLHGLQEDISRIEGELAAKKEKAEHLKEAIQIMRETDSSKLSSQPHGEISEPNPPNTGEGIGALDALFEAKSQLKSDLLEHFRGMEAPFLPRQAVRIFLLNRSLPSDKKTIDRFEHYVAQMTKEGKLERVNSTSKGRWLIVSPESGD